MATERTAEDPLRPVNIRPEDPKSAFLYEPFMPTGTNWLEGKKAIVTGGTRGIGLAVARTLAANGADVAITYKSPESDPVAAQLVEEFQDKYNSTLVASRLEITDLSLAQQFVGGVHDRFESIDILVNNAGVNDDTPFARRLNDEKQRARYEAKWANTWAKYNTMQWMSEAVWPYMVDQKTGKIVSITSVSQIIGGPG